jgi:hypothetical protein
MRTKPFILIIGILLLFKCSNNRERIKIELGDNDSIHMVLNSSFFFDNMESFQYNPWRWMKIGNFIDKKRKTALLIYTNKDTVPCLYKLELYEALNSQWKLVGQADSLEGYPVNFDVKFLDYNFDNKTDIFLAASASNGHVLIRGHLITIDLENKIFDYHKDLFGLSNLEIDSTLKLVTSEELVNCNNPPGIEFDKLYYKWIDNKLELIKKKRE